MPLAQRYVDPRYFGPALREYMAKGAYGGGGMSAPSLPQPQQAQNQIDPAAAISLWKMLGSGEAGAGASGASGASTGAASGAGGGGSGGLWGSLGTAAGNAAPFVAAGALLSAYASNAHDVPYETTIFNDKGWGSYPVDSIRQMADGDFKGAAASMLKGGGGPAAMLGVALEGGDSEDYLKANIPFIDLFKAIKGGSSLDLINGFARPWG